MHGGGCSVDFIVRRVLSFVVCSNMHAGIELGGGVGFRLGHICGGDGEALCSLYGGGRGAGVRLVISRGGAGMGQFCP